LKKRKAPPVSGTSPMFTNAIINFALSAAMMKSPERARLKPAPAAAPLTATMTILFMDFRPFVTFPTLPMSPSILMSPPLLIRS